MKLATLFITLSISVISFAQSSDTVEYVPVEFTDYMSPNQDNSNDAFIITNIELYPESILRIYNRWGNLIYKTTGYENNWKGRANVGTLIGKDVTDGVYYFVLEISDFSITKKGSITLRR